MTFIDFELQHIKSNQTKKISVCQKVDK